MTMDVEVLKRPLRALRGWPPVNRPVTTMCRACVRLLGVPPGPLARFLPRTGLVEASLPNGHVLQMWSQADDDVTGYVYWNGWSGHETEASPLFYDLARSSRTTIDVGAYVGYFTLLAAQANPNGNVYAFEPNQLVYQRLTHNASLNEAPNVSCVRAAVGSENGTAEFFQVKDGIHSSASLSQEFMESIVDLRRLECPHVPVVSIDEFVLERDISNVDLMKIDTETTEDAVFHGMTRTLKEDRPIIFCEILQEAAGRSIEQVLQDVGYRYFLLTDQGPVSQDRVSPRLPWRNYCFVPNEGVDPRERAWRVSK